MSARTALCDAVNSVAGLNCLPYPRGAVSPGEAFISLGRVNYPNTFGGVVTWGVWVALSTANDDNERAIEEKWPILKAALSEEMNLVSMTPYDLGNSVLGVYISGTREEEI